MCPHLSITYKAKDGQEYILRGLLKDDGVFASFCVHRASSESSYGLHLQHSSEAKAFQHMIEVLHS